jgi:hypothetical protein
MVNKTLLSALGLILASGAANASLSNPQVDPASQDAAQVIEELVRAGFVKVDATSGCLVLEKSVLEILKEAGVAKERPHSEVQVAACGSTHGGPCYSPK